MYEHILLTGPADVIDVLFDILNEYKMSSKNRIIPKSLRVLPGLVKKDGVIAIKVHTRQLEKDVIHLVLEDYFFRNVIGKVVTRDREFEPFRIGYFSARPAIWWQNESVDVEKIEEEVWLDLDIDESLEGSIQEITSEEDIIKTGVELVLDNLRNKIGEDHRDLTHKVPFDLLVNFVKSATIVKSETAAKIALVNYLLKYDYQLLNVATGDVVDFELNGYADTSDIIVMMDHSIYSITKLCALNLSNFRLNRRY